MLNLESIASAVALAREYLEDMARNDKGPIRFHVRGCQEGGELFDRQLSTDSFIRRPGAGRYWTRMPAPLHSLRCWSLSTVQA